MYRLCCLFIINDIETTETQGPSNITVLYHSPSLWGHERHSTHNAEAARTKKSPRLRGCGVKGLTTPPQPLTKVPSKCKRGESSSNGVAQRPLDRCHRRRTRRARTRRARAPASGSGTSSISRPKSDRGRSCSIQQQLRLFRMDTVDVDCHPCASKQEQIVKFACREQGLGRAVERSKRSSW